MKIGPSSTSNLPEVEALNQDIGENYEITELIGSGGMGAVYLATQKGLERQVAIKILPGDIEGLRKRFGKEAHVLAQCSHPNIVSVYDFGETKSGIPFIVMEYVRGGDLQQMLDRGRIPFQDGFSMLRQICDGLAYAHSRDLVHLDIKPANILIDDEGIVKIVDFGLARIIGESPAQSSIGGTALYSAPETINNKTGIDQRADIYSLGIVIYQLLTGDLPMGLWMPPSEVDPGLPRDFDKVVEMALKKNPAVRYQNIVELEADILDIYFSRPETESESENLDHPELQKRLWYVFLGLVVSQFLGIGFNIWFNQRHIIPLFFEGESYRFTSAVNVYNLIAYIPLLSIWGWVVFTLPNHRNAKRRVINLPWIGAGISAIGWAGSIPGLWLPLRDAGAGYALQLSISVCIGAAIALSQVFLVIDLLSQKLLYSHFFTRSEKPWCTPGGLSLSLTRRGLIWTISSGICPVIALLLLVDEEHRLFAGTAALACISFGFFGSWLLGRLVVDPLNHLADAAAKVGSGDLRTRVDIVGSDELGILGYEFNRMVAGLRERRYIRESLGRTTERAVTDAILNRPDAQHGVIRDVVVLAVHLDGYESLMTELEPDEAIRLSQEINDSFTRPVERFKGMPHQNLGEIFTAVFGATPESTDSAKEAERAGNALFEDLQNISPEEGWTVGIGIAAGEALTGTLKVPGDREFLVAGEVVEKAVRLAREANGKINSTVS
ncbi:MAG: protein kinase [Verrucomicrobiales bacterium]|nr:protein kinase [Verrucomicrobiales bacterium]